MKKGYLLFILLAIGLFSLTAVHAEEGFFARVAGFFRGTSETGTALNAETQGTGTQQDIPENDVPAQPPVAEETGPSEGKPVELPTGKPVPACSACHAVVCKDNDGIFLCPASLRDCKEKYDGCTELSCRAGRACAMPACEGAYDTGRVEDNCPVYACPGGRTCGKPICDGVYDTGRQDEYGCTVYACPAIACSACIGGVDTGSKDEYGCPIFDCGGRACAKPACDGAFDTGRVDENNCHVYACPGTGCTACRGGIDTGRVDENNCPVYNCPAAPGCELDGRLYKPGESFPSGDGCNTCTCSENGMIQCTLRACGGIAVRT